MAAPLSCNSLSVFFAGIVLLFGHHHLFLHVSRTAGFSVESPLDDPASTPLSHFNASIDRSASTVNSNKAKSPLRRNGASAIVTSYSWYYLVTYHIGTKNRQTKNRQRVSAVMHTMKDFTWVLTLPCPSCYPTNLPKFNRLLSKTFSPVDCRDANCFLLPQHDCVGNNNCRYTYSVDTNIPATVTGFLSTDTFQIESSRVKKPVLLKNMIFGCTIYTDGNFMNESLGIFGLGPGPFSLISQMGTSYGNIFSYCLPYEFHKTSYLYFGSAVKVRAGVPTTTLHSTTYHKVTLVSITVTGGTVTRPITLTVPLNTEAVRQDGNIAIDTGRHLTYIDSELMRKLWDELKERSPIEATTKLLNRDDLYRNFEHCFNTTNAPENYEMPGITFGFSGGARLVLQKKNAFVDVDNIALCLTIASNEANGGISTLGNHAQIDNRFVFDLNIGKLVFYPEVC